MSAIKNTFIASAAAFALIAPLAGSANADYNGFKRDGIQKLDNGLKQTVASGPRRYNPRGIYRGERRRPISAVRTPRIDARINNQQRRIRRGRNTGQLTRLEAIRLSGHLFSIRSARSIARIDGRVTPQERRRLQAMLDTNSKRIRRLARNGRYN